MRQVNVALIGCGHVGGGVFRALRLNGGLVASRLGTRLKIRSVAVRDPKKRRSCKVPPSILTADWKAAVDDPKADVVVELIGGMDTARAVVSRALGLGKPVVTANKALLSECGEDLFERANLKGTNLYYEASVAGGIPIIKVLREALIGNRFSHIYGILNGTCNYILTRMKQSGASFASVLKEAQRLGYAEAEPSMDVDGFDAMHKTGILASLAHGFWVNPKQIFVEGMRKITPLDIQFADQLGYTIKLISSIKTAGVKGRRGDSTSTIEVSVCPALIKNSHVLANVNDVFNAIYLEGDVVGETLYYGRGAGAEATASAVLSDLADATLDLKFETKHRIPPFVPHEQEGAVLPWERAVSQYYLRLTVVDRPGTMSAIANVLARAGIGISSIIQPEGHIGERVPLILMIHDATNLAVRNAVETIRLLDVVKQDPRTIRVESFETSYG